MSSPIYIGLNDSEGENQLTIPKVALEGASPRKENASAFGRQQSADNSALGLSLNVSLPSLQVPRSSSFLANDGRQNSNSSAASGSVFASAGVTIDSDFDHDREADFDGESSVLNKSLSNSKRQAGISAVLQVRYASSVEVSPSREPTTSFELTDGGDVGQAAEDEALLQEQDQRWMHQFNELRARQLAFLAQAKLHPGSLQSPRPAPLQLQGRDPSWLPCGEEVSVPKQAVVFKHPLTFGERVRNCISCCIGPSPSSIEDSSQSLQAQVDDWEVFRPPLSTRTGPTP